MSDEIVFLACPTYNGQVDSGTAMGLYAAASKERRIFAQPNGKSLLASNCNYLWTLALNARDVEKAPVKWFAMLHADIEPEHWWLDKLIDIAEANGADMLSAAVPIKDSRGITSHAIASPLFGDDYIENHSGPLAQFGRLTQRQIWHEQFPETFDINAAADALETLPGGLRVDSVPRNALLLNTGCMVVRLDRDWDYGKIFFSMIDGIHWNGSRWGLYDVSEDWLFSWRVHQQGGRCMGTRAVRVVHKGLGLFPNDKPWGSVESDCDYAGELAKA